MQKAVIVTGSWSSNSTWKDSTEELNKYLSDGWTVVSASPMGAYGYSAYGSNWSTNDSDHGFASLVIIQNA